MICNLKPVLRCAEESKCAQGEKLKVTSAYHLNAVAKS